jgi:hypothetical protein
LDYFYAPYEKGKKGPQGEKLFNRYMSQKHKRGELAVVTPSGKIRSESKTERMKKYGKTAVALKNAKFEDDASSDSQRVRRNTRYKGRESIS